MAISGRSILRLYRSGFWTLTRRASKPRTMRALTRCCSPSVPVFRTFGVQGILDPVEAQNTSRTVNDFLAEQVRAHPSRYIGMATLALQDPDHAVRELERCATELGFKGS